MRRHLPAWIPGLALAALALWVVPALTEAPLDAPIVHDVDEDWDWQLTTWEASRRQLAQGQLPTWAPWVAGGVPLLANPESPALYPGFVLAVVAGTTVGMKLVLALHLLLLVYAGWLAGREAGLSPPAAHGAALFSLASVGLPASLAWGHQMFSALGWLPLAWAAQRRGRPALAGLSLAMPMLYGAHYLFLYGALWLALDAAISALRAERLRWLALVLLLDGLLLLPAPAPGWKQPLGLALLAAVVVALLTQRPEQSWREVARAGQRLAITAVVAALLIAPKVVGLGDLRAMSERLSRARRVSELSFEADLPQVFAILSGGAERLSGHEGINVLNSPWPVLAAAVGLAVAAWRKPRWALVGLVFWILGMGHLPPLALLAPLHRLPGFEMLEKVERYHLIWTLFAGWGCGLLLDTVSSRSRGLAMGLAALLLALWLPRALPLARHSLQATAPVPAVTPGPFRQHRGGPAPGFEHVLANQGRIDVSIAAPPDERPPDLRGAEDLRYRGEAWIEGAEALPAAIDGSRVYVEVPRAGRVVLNQRWASGWRVDGGEVQAWRGLASAELPPGPHTFRYWPRGLGWALLAHLLGWVSAAFELARRRRRRPAG